MTQLVERMRRYGTTIFAEMSALAVATNSINLGQGFPDSDGPQQVLDAAMDAIRAGHNQYPPGRGVPELRRAIAAHQARHYGLRYDPETEIVVTAGATEALAATIMALCEPGDEVIALEPTYDSYSASISLAQAVLVPVRLQHPDYRLDVERLRAAVTDRTRLVLINSPHNPTGHVLDHHELQAIADLATERDLVVVTDEVYEHLTFDGRRHQPLATFPGMRERTVQISSAGKTFAVTGWKIGWICSTPALVTAITTVKQFLTYVNGGPFQYAVAVGLGLPDEVVDEVRDRLQSARDQLVGGLTAAGLETHESQGTYFVTADIASIGEHDSIEFCRELPKRCGVVAIPSQVFYTDPRGVETLVRFAFCKRPEVIAEAAERLATLR